jgi:glycine dehydrogenase subunit 2
VAEVSERDLVAHFTRLSHRQFSVDLGAYPLGSCTMKYNPKMCDAVAGAARPGRRPPGAPASLTQGWLALLVELEEVLCEITGMAAATLQPAAGRPVSSPACSSCGPGTRPRARTATR